MHFGRSLLRPSNLTPLHTRRRTATNAMAVAVAVAVIMAARRLEAAALRLSLGFPPSARFFSVY